MNYCELYFDLKTLPHTGECYIKLCETENAERELKKAMELTKNESPYLTLARLYVSKDRIDDAIGVYNAALK